MPIAEAFERDGEEAFRAREAEVVGAAARAGRRRRDRPRRRQRPLRARARGARPPRRRLAAGRRRRRPGGGSPAATGRWPRSAEDVARLLEERLPLYERSPTRSCRPGDRGLIGRAMPSLLALAELPPGTKMLWAASASGEYPVFVGPGLLERGLVAAARDGASASPTATVGALYADRARAARGADRGRAGRAREDDGRGRAGAARAGPRRDDPRGPRRRPRRRGRRRPGGLLRPPLPARRAGRPGADHARRPGRLRLRRQDRRRPARGQELRRRLPPAGRRARRHVDPGQPARARSWPPASSRC